MHHVTFVRIQKNWSRSNIVTIGVKKQGKSPLIKPGSVVFLSGRELIWFFAQQHAKRKECRDRVVTTGTNWLAAGNSVQGQQSPAEQSEPADGLMSIPTATGVVATMRSQKRRDKTAVYPDKAQYGACRQPHNGKKYSMLISIGWHVHYIVFFILLAFCYRVATFLTVFNQSRSPCHNINHLFICTITPNTAF